VAHFTNSEHTITGTKAPERSIHCSASGSLDTRQLIFALRILRACPGVEPASEDARVAPNARCFDSRLMVTRHLWRRRRGAWPAWPMA
jgi:hypothetical protein